MDEISPYFFPENPAADTISCDLLCEPTPPLKIGILAGIDQFADSLLQEINRRGKGLVTAECCLLSAQKLGESIPYRVIIDRISHCIEFYRPYLKRAALSGCYIVNNPFWFPVDDKFFNAEVAAKLGIKVPKTYCLPSRYASQDLEPDDFRNLDFPIDWEKLAQDIGFPALLKPYDGYGWREVYVVNSLEELLSIYNDSGADVMLFQEYIDFEHYVRVFVVGKTETLPVRYLPQERKYLIDHSHLSPEMGEKITQDSRKICATLGYDINTVEFAIKDGIPYAIDFMNPVPEARPEIITEEYYAWLVDKTARMSINYALNPPLHPQIENVRQYF